VSLLHIWWWPCFLCKSTPQNSKLEFHESIQSPVIDKFCEYVCVWACSHEHACVHVCSYLCVCVHVFTLRASEGIGFQRKPPFSYCEKEDRFEASWITKQILLEGPYQARETYERDLNDTWKLYIWTWLFAPWKISSILFLFLLNLP
jgi:hypothetical protein